MATEPLQKPTTTVERLTLEALPREIRRSIENKIDDAKENGEGMKFGINLGVVKGTLGGKDYADDLAPVKLTIKGEVETKGQRETVDLIAYGYPRAGDAKKFIITHWGTQTKPNELHEVKAGFATAGNNYITVDTGKLAGTDDKGKAVDGAQELGKFKTELEKKSKPAIIKIETPAPAEAKPTIIKIETPAPAEAKPGSMNKSVTDYHSPEVETSKGYEGSTAPATPNLKIGRSLA